MASDELNGAVHALLECDPGLPVPNPTEAFWQHIPHPLASVQSSSIPSSADVVIIGSGITGCSTAKALLEKSPHSKVVLLEARGLASGATGRNGGHLTSSAVEDYSALVKQFGKPMAKKIARYTFRNIERVYEVSKSFGESVEKASEVRRVEGLVIFRDDKADEFPKSVSLFEEDNPDLKGRHQIVSAKDMLLNHGVPNTKGGYTGPAGALWPYRLVTNVFEQLRNDYGNRFSIETFTPVTSITRTADGEYPSSVNTSRGPIKARKVIHCTNGHAGHLLPGLRGGLFPLRGNMSVQQRGKAFPNIGGRRTWSFFQHGHVDPETGVIDYGLYYMTQNEHTGDIFIGGESETLHEVITSDDSQLGPNSSTALKTVLPRLFGDKGWAPEEDRVKSLWSGIMGFTADGMPLVGRIPESASGRPDGDEWIAAGFNGYGMANAWLCGEGVVGMILSEDVSDWLPEAYLTSEERMKSLTPDKAIQRLFHN